MATGSRQRTAGLPREEAAALAAMSTDYYARLEQQRGRQPSDQTVAAIAQGLRLTLDERDHLFRLAGHTAPGRVLRSDHVSSFRHPQEAVGPADRISNRVMCTGVGYVCSHNMERDADEDAD